MINEYQQNYDEVDLLHQTGQHTSKPWRRMAAPPSGSPGLLADALYTDVACARGVAALLAKGVFYAHVLRHLRNRSWAHHCC
eukprot:6186787-Pleurochrysis_carterae.AAC.2